MDVIEQVDRWQQKYSGWKSRGVTDALRGYPFVENSLAPFTPARRALSMLNLAVITSAGAYIDGSDPFDTSSPEGDFSFREIPSDIALSDLRFSAHGYDSSFVEKDPNVQVPLTRLHEFAQNRVIGQLNSAFWSFCGFIPHAARLVSELLPQLIERIHNYEVQAAILIPASRLCHQSVALAARAIEQTGIPTITLAVARDVVEMARPPRAGFYAGQLGSVAGQAGFAEHQRRVLDEALRWIEPMGEPGLRKLVVELESEVEAARGER